MSQTSEARDESLRPLFGYCDFCDNWALNHEFDKWGNAVIFCPKCDLVYEFRT